MKKTVIFVTGEVCAGKDTYCKQKLSYIRQVDIGETVRKIYNTQERIYDPNLDEKLCTEVLRVVEEEKLDTVVVTGVRQVSLFNLIAKNFEVSKSIWLHVPRTELKRRFIERGAEKDAKLSFEEVIERDNGLGLRDLKLHLMEETECRIVENYRV